MEFAIEACKANRFEIVSFLDCSLDLFDTTCIGSSARDLLLASVHDIRILRYLFGNYIENISVPVVSKCFPNF